MLRKRRPLSRRPPCAAIALGLCLLASLPACTGLEPAVVGAGATAAESGATIFEKGKVTSFEAVTFEDAVAAARATINLLQLRVVADEPKIEAGHETCRHRFSLRDEHGASVVLIVDRRTPAVTRIHADVGTFGPTLLGGLIVNKTIEELKRMHAYERVVPPPPPTPLPAPPCPPAPATP